MSEFMFDKYFEECGDFDSPGEDGSLRFYSSGLSRTPETVFFLIHGAGFSGLSWACFSKALMAEASTNGSFFLFLKPASFKISVFCRFGCCCCGTRFKRAWFFRTCCLLSFNRSLGRRHV